MLRACQGLSEPPEVAVKAKEYVCLATCAIAARQLAASLHASPRDECCAEPQQHTPDGAQEVL